MKNYKLPIQIGYFLCFFWVQHTIFAQQTKSIFFQKQEWISTDTTVSIEPVSQELSLQKGVVFMKNVVLKEGEIEVEIKATTLRSFAALVFHLDEKELHYEDVYIRTHKANQDDALQYCPVFYNLANWQLYAEYQANVPLKKEGWNKLKIVFDLEKAQIFLNENEKPVLEIPKLRQDKVQANKIGIRVLNGAVFRNFAYKPLSKPIVLVTVPKYAKMKEGIIKKWEISTLKSGFPTEKPNIEQEKWTAAETDAEGILDISKYVKKTVADNFEENPLEYVWLKTVIVSKVATTKRLDFEFTNRVLIICNQQKIFEGGNAFRQKGSLFRGDFDKKLVTNTLFIPLVAGENIIYWAVGSKSNGWAVMAALGEGSN